MGDGEFVGRENDKNPRSLANSDGRVINSPDGGFKTAVDGVTADGEKGGLPVFNVSQNEFYQNMSWGRKRLRFKSGTGAQQYMSKTRGGSSFFISFDDGKQKYLRKVK